MTLKQLKESTLYQSSDLDDMEVLVSVSRDGKRQLEPLVFLGMLPMGERGCVIAGGLTEMQRMVEKGELAPPEGYIKPTQELKDLIEGNDEGDSTKGS